MGNNENKAELLDRIRGYATHIHECRNLPSLSGGGPFERCRALAARIDYATTLLLQFRWDLAPEAILSRLDGPMRECADRMRHESNPEKVQDLLSSHAGSIEQTIFWIVPLVFAIEYREVLSSETNAIKAAAGNISTDLAKTTEDIAGLHADANEGKSRIDKLVSDAQDLLATVTVSRHACHFFEEAKAHRKASRVWLAAVVALASVMLGLLYVWMDQMPDLSRVDESLRTAAMIRFTALRILALSLLAYGIGFCARHFAGNRHNYVVNRHRRNALETFHAFVNSTQERAVRDAVLLHAAQAIYQPQQTGFGKGIDPPSPSVVDMLGALRSRS